MNEEIKRDPEKYEKALKNILENNKNELSTL